jgi:superfamily I DNA/RNA helicase/mRNA-degrading endonuclease RelE of RelBE toxin-antitoxin system
MIPVLADTFTASLARLSNDEQKQAKLTVFDLQLNPDQPGLQFHRVDKAISPDVWSLRVNRDLRIIVQKRGDNVLLVHVGHHDDAYDWARRRRIEPHPTTGVLQIVEVRELVEERPTVTPVVPAGPDLVPPERPVATPIFTALSDEQLLSVGVPADWLNDVRVATDDSFFDLERHLPPEARDALMEYAQNGVLPVPPPPVSDPMLHPDTQRRFRVSDNLDELRAALDAPFEKWAVFLHPSQRAAVERSYGGPARIVGSAGTGKTVVALHRVARLLETKPDAKVLLTTFSEPLSKALRKKLRILVGDRPALLERVQIGSFERVAAELYELATNRAFHLAKAQVITAQLGEAAKNAGVTEVTQQFLRSEWTNVVDAWQLESAVAYGEVPRLGRKSRLGARQRERLWPVFDSVRKYLAARALLTEAGLFAATAAIYAQRDNKPFTHIVVDEAQDLGVPELRFLASIAPKEPDALFFAGDLGQRIFRQPFSWKTLGVDVRGRSVTLKVNYRTSHQIRMAADRLLPASVRDVDGIEDNRQGTISIFDGPEPEIIVAPDVAGERAAVATRLQSAISDGYSPSDIGVFVRSEAELPRARAAVRDAGLAARSLVDGGAPGEVLVGTMHLAKGLEFRLVIAMACDEAILPAQDRLKQIADDYELEEVLRTERQLLYVALTRARDRLIVSAVAPASEFVEELSRPLG